MKNLIEKIRRKENLSSGEIEQIMHTIMDGKAVKEDISAFLLSLREKGPTVDEITGAAQIMRRFVLRVHSSHEVILDTCGTGGDRQQTFNISTIAAFVVAGSGIAVAKHGNRSVSSRCGSADLLESLGVNLNVEQDHLKECLDKIGIAFLFAQRLHPAMKNVAAVRKELGVETIFNVLGPLTNPAMATHQMMGVYNRDLVEPMAKVLRNLGLKRAMVVHGSDGLDEITTTGETFISEFNGNDIVSYSIDPKELNIAVVEPEDLKGGDVPKNTEIARDVLRGKKGAHRDIVTLNAGCGLYVAGEVRTISEGIKLAQHAIDSGNAHKKLEALKEFTNRAR